MSASDAEDGVAAAGAREEPAAEPVQAREHESDTGAQTIGAERGARDADTASQPTKARARRQIDSDSGESEGENGGATGAPATALRHAQVRSRDSPPSDDAPSQSDGGSRPRRKRLRRRKSHSDDSGSHNSAVGGREKTGRGPDRQRRRVDRKNAAQPTAVVYAPSGDLPDPESHIPGNEGRVHAQDGLAYDALLVSENEVTRLRMQVIAPNDEDADEFVLFTKETQAGNPRPTCALQRFAGAAAADDAVQAFREAFSTHTGVEFSDLRTIETEEGKMRVDTVAHGFDAVAELTGSEFDAEASSSDGEPSASAAARAAAQDDSGDPPSSDDSRVAPQRSGSPDVETRMRGRRTRRSGRAARMVGGDESDGAVGSEASDASFASLPSDFDSDESGAGPNDSDDEMDDREHELFPLSVVSCGRGAFGRAVETVGSRASAFPLHKFRPSALRDAASALRALVDARDAVEDGRGDARRKRQEDDGPSIADLELPFAAALPIRSGVDAGQPISDETRALVLVRMFELAHALRSIGSCLRAKSAKNLHAAVGDTLQSVALPLPAAADEPTSSNGAPHGVRELARALAEAVRAARVPCRVSAAYAVEATPQRRAAFAPFRALPRRRVCWYAAAAPAALSTALHGAVLPARPVPAALLPHGGALAVYASAVDALCGLLGRERSAWGNRVDAVALVALECALGSIATQPRAPGSLPPRAHSVEIAPGTSDPASGTWKTLANAGSAPVWMPSEASESGSGPVYVAVQQHQRGGARHPLFSS